MNKMIFQTMKKYQTQV